MSAESSVRAVLADQEAGLIDLRRDLHAHPEPSWEEIRTTQVLMDRLGEAGLTPQVGPTGTGVICDIGPAPYRVAIRGDIDALRMDDGKSVPYRSTVDGVCHACGHDVHTAAVVGAALALAETIGDRSVGVRIILQAAEEAIPGGAVSILDAGLVDEVDAIIALHCDPSMPVGRIGVSAGPITSAADQLTIRLEGPGGHTGRPHQSVDLVHVAARLVVDIPLSMHRLVDPRDGLNVTFGAIHAGNAGNVIPAEATIVGSLRASGRGAWEAAPELLPQLVASIAEPLGAKWELDHVRGAPPIVNDEIIAGAVAESGRRVLGENSVGPTAQSTGGEDFSWYGERARLGYFRLGVRQDGVAPYDIHSPVFDVDERAIALGAAVLATTALDLIDNGLVP